MTRITIFMIMLALSAAGLRASNENVVIESITDVYRIVPESGGRGIREVKNSQEIIFRARRTSDNAVATAYYNDRISIDKATGAKAQYGMTDDDDVFYSDSRMCMMTLPLKKEGDKAKARFERTYRAPELFCRIPLTKIYDVESYTVKFVIPLSLASRLKVSGRNLPATAMRTEEKTGKDVTVTYSITDLKSPDDVERRLPLSLTSPTLYVTGQFADVNALYRHILSYTRLRQDPDSMKVVELAREVTGGCATDSARIAAILDYVHDNIRYIAVEHGIYGHMPDLPSEVLRKRFGDCKGSAALLRAMLRGIGLDGRFVWVGTREIPTEWTDYPIMASGNHMIAATMTGDSLLYLDGTATYNGIGRYPAGIRGRQTLVEDTDTACIVGRVGTLPPAADFNGIDITYTLCGQESVTADYREVFAGQFNNAFRHAYDNTAESRRSGHFTEYLGSVRKGARATLTGLDYGRDESVITGHLTVPNVVRVIGNDLYVDLNPFPEMSRFAIDTKKRNGADGWLGSTSSRRITATFAIPDGYTVTMMPEALDIDNDWVAASISPAVSEKKDTVSVTFEFTIHNPRIPAESIEAYNDDIRRLARALSSQLQLTGSE